MHLRLGALAVAVIIVASGCGGNGDGQDAQGESATEESPFAGRWIGLVVDRGTQNIYGDSDNPTQRYTVTMDINLEPDGTLSGRRTDSDDCGGRLVERVRRTEHATFEYVETLAPDQCVPESQVTVAPHGRFMDYFELTRNSKIGADFELEASGELKLISSPAGVTEEGP